MPRPALYTLSALLLLTVIGLSLAGPIPQDPAYHGFADQRTLLGIPNFWNVASNLPMLFIGGYLLWHSLAHWHLRPAGVPRWIPLLLGVGVFSAFFGSAYYHWAPDNYTLVWDRLPMTLMFMPLLSLIIFDYLGAQQGRVAFFILIPLGVFSVFYWHFTEAAGHGDLRPYAFVQFFPMAVVPFLLLLFPGKVDYVKYIYLILGWYIAAKLAEHFDAAVFHTLGFWSGHTVKHLVGSVSLIYVVKLMLGWRVGGRKVALPLRIEG
ncbi:MAG: hypothetical protein KDD27_23225 [Saprospiraceae bacterium]|nr:hypothetical protein [Saprospiraceae bacterium]